MVDEDPYKLPTIDESKWFIGGHLGSQIQSCNWQVGLGLVGGLVSLCCVGSCGLIHRHLGPQIQPCNRQVGVTRRPPCFAACVSNHGALPSNRSLLLHPPNPALQIVNCTTPANYYHVLRRQIHRQFRKPLVRGRVVAAWLGWGCCGMEV